MKNMCAIIPADAAQPGDIFCFIPCVVRGSFEQGESHMVLSTVDSMVTTGLALHEMLALCAQSILAEAETTSARQVILQAAETLRKITSRNFALPTCWQRRT